MSTRVGKTVTPKTDPKTGKVRLVRVHKLDVSKRRKVHAQAARSAAKWTSKGKPQ
jgi:hypothetical protein